MQKISTFLKKVIRLLFLYFGKAFFNSFQLITLVTFTSSSLLLAVSVVSSSSILGIGLNSESSALNFFTLVLSSKGRTNLCLLQIHTEHLQAKYSDQLVLLHHLVITTLPNTLNYLN